MAGALAAAIVGLGGFDGGVLWLVAGVWTVRAVWGSPVGLAWGIASLGVAARWGTTSLADVEAAARLFAPSVAAGSATVRAGTAIALAAAILSEAAVDGLRGSWVERAAAAIGLVALVALFCAPGPGEALSVATLAWWAGAGAASAGAALVLAAPADRLPAAVLPICASLGVAVAMLS